MIVDREELLTLLKIVSAGAALPPRMVVLEQSDCFVFHKDKVVAFNDEIMVSAPNPLDFDCVVQAIDLLKILGALPDKDVEVIKKKKNLIVKGKRREVGLTVQAETLLKYDTVPPPKEWTKVRDGVTGMLKQASRTCGKDLANPLTTVVHCNGNVIEATDNFRLFQCKMETGIPKDLLIPAYALTCLEAIPLKKVSVSKGFVHFTSTNKAVISVRCHRDDYLPFDDGLEIKERKSLKFPENLAQMIDRAETMGEGTDPLIQIEIKTGQLVITARKESGWYKERKKITYEGKTLRFQVNPKFLAEILERTNKVAIGEGKMKIKTDSIQFVVCLEATEE